jgi:uncharacterized delta-60 repeat protein
MRPLARVLTALVLAVPLVQAAPAVAVPGQLDLAFGVGGIAHPTGPKLGSIEDMALAPGGKIVVAGTYTFYNQPPPTLDRSSDLFLARFLPTGDLDTTFSRDGVLTVDIEGLDEAYGVTVQPDGKIVVVGEARGSIFTVPRMLIARITSAGALDTSFDGDGWEIVEPPFVDSSGFSDVAIGADGSIYAGGTASEFQLGFVVMKYSPTGAIQTYGNREWGALVDFGGFQDEIGEIALQSDGKLVAAGWAEIGDTNEFDFALARLTTTGELDTTFGGGDGKVTTDVGEEDAALGVALAQDGRIAVAGTRALFGSESGNDFTVLRYTAAGTLDTSFSGDGKVTGLFGADTLSESTDVAVQPNGRIVVAGTRNGPDRFAPDIALARYTNTGNLDSTFGANGKVVTDTEGYETANGVALQPDGRILVSGQVGEPAVLRYLGDDVPPPPPPPPGAKVVTVADFSFRPASARPDLGGAVRWQFDGPSSHTATDNTGMGMFDSGTKTPGSTFDFTFNAAGAYAYRCTIHPTTTMKPGKVEVPMTASPASGTTSTEFTLTWAAAAPAPGFVFDVQLKRPGATKFSAWRTGVTILSDAFVPDGGTGSYAFRARLRNSANARAAQWSAIRALAVS